MDVVERLEQVEGWEVREAGERGEVVAWMFWREVVSAGNISACWFLRGLNGLLSYSPHQPIANSTVLHPISSPTSDHLFRLRLTVARSPAV